MKRLCRYILFSGLVMISPVLMAGDEVDENYTVSFDQLDIESSAGGSFTVTVTLDSTDGDALSGVQWGVCHDPDYFEDLVNESAANENDGDVVRVDFAGLDTTFEALNTFDGEGWNMGILMNVVTQATIDPDTYDAYDVTYNVKSDATQDTSTELEYCALGTPPVPTAVIISGLAITPVQDVLTVTIAPPPDDPFLRGDVDSNGEVEALIDATVVLEWGFTNGDPPACMEAADFDDSGSVHPLLDAILLIDWGFNGGAAPADPGPDSCDEDPTEDDVPCDTLSDLCDPG